MAHSLVRIKSSLVNKPHLIEENTFNGILEYVNQRIEGNADIIGPQAEAETSWDHRYIPETKTGVMHISGPLTYRTTGWEAYCGGTSYEMLKEQMNYFVEKGAKTVSMMVDSGGGQAQAMIDSANYIRNLANENGIKIIAYVDGMSASAAYGISCIADEIIMSSDSLVGSIGVLIQLYNDSKYLEKIGYERTFITAGKDKVPYDKDGAFTEAFIDRLQEQVDTLYESFTTHVANHRSLDVQAVKDTEANVFMAEEAIKLGLADKVMTIEEFYEYVADVAQTNIEDKDMGLSAFKLNTKEDKAEMAKLEELTAQLEVEQTARATADASLAAVVAQLAEAQEQLAAFAEAQKVAAEAAAAAALAKREAALAEVLPVADVPTYLTNMSALDDGAFAFMVDQLAAVKNARAEEFKPVGQDGVIDDAEPDAVEALKAAGVAAAKAVRR
ncbi:head maturation protease [Pseudomonas phage vB_PpS_SYP]|nr:head maturation protease [Pseudomonas phage vB_PpS_SYP]